MFDWARRNHNAHKAPLFLESNLCGFVTAMTRRGFFTYNVKLNEIGHLQRDQREEKGDKKEL